MNNELNINKKICDQRYATFCESDELNVHNHTLQQKYIIQKLIKLNKLFNETEYNDNEFITIDVSLSILYEPKIENSSDDRNKEIKIFKEKLGRFNNISIFLSKYGHIVYHLDGKYYYDIYFDTYETNINTIIQFWDKHVEYIESQIDEFHLEPDEYDIYTIPISKKYKDHLHSFITIDSNMELSKFVEYMDRNVPIGLSGLYKQLTFMENLFFDKMNEVVEMNKRLIDLKL
jgi:hypothetical protein